MLIHRLVVRGWVPGLSVVAVLGQLALTLMVIDTVSKQGGGHAKAPPSPTEAAETTPVLTLATVKSDSAVAEYAVAEAKPSPTPLDEYDTDGLRTLVRRAGDSVADAFASAKRMRPTAEGVDVGELYAAVRVRPEVLIARVNWSAFGTPLRSATDLSVRAKSATADSLDRWPRLNWAEASAAVRHREAAERASRERASLWLAQCLTELVEHRLTITLYGPSTAAFARPNAEIVRPGTSGSPITLAAEGFPKLPAAGTAKDTDWKAALDAIWKDENADDRVKEARAGLKKLGIDYSTDGVKYDPASVALTWEFVVTAERDAATVSEVRALLLAGPVSASMEKSGWIDTDRDKIKTESGFKVTLKVKEEDKKDVPYIPPAVPCDPVVAIPVTIGGCGFAPAVPVGCSGWVVTECGGCSSPVVGVGSPTVCGCGPRSGGLFGFGLLTRPLFNRCR